MKNIFFILFFCTSILNFSQSNEINQVSFLAVEESPIYKGCEAFETNEAVKKCMVTKLNNLIKDEFDHELINCLKQKTIYNQKDKRRIKKCIPFLISGEKRIFLNFTINEEGAVVNITPKTPHIKLTKEATRVAKLIPNMIPGKEKGKRVRVSYSLPIDLIVK